MDGFLNSVWTSVFDPQKAVLNDYNSPRTSLTPPKRRSTKLDPLFEAFIEACKQGNIVAVGSALSEGNIDPSAENNLALKTAISERQYQIVSLLLLNKNVDPSMDNNRAFKLACEAGDVLLVRVLLTDPRVDPAADGNQGFKIACTCGHTEVVRLLMTDQRIDPTAGSNHGIKFAAENGHESTVEALLLDTRVNPADDDDAAIKWAATAGHFKVVSLLLRDPRVNPQAFENYAIRNAAENGHFDVVQALLNDKRVNPADQNNYAIKRASRNGHTRVVEILLKDPRVDPSCGANNSINWAARNGHLELVKLLLKDPRVDPSEGNLAITWASENEQHEVVQLLSFDPRVIKGLESSSNPLLKVLAQMVATKNSQIADNIEKDIQGQLEGDNQRQHLGELSDQIRSLQTELQKKDELIHNINFELEKAKADAVNLESVVTAIKDSNPETGSQLLSQFKENKKTEETIQEQKREIQSRNAQIDDFKIKLREGEELVARLNQQIERLNVQLNSQVLNLQEQVIEMKVQGENVCLQLKSQVTSLEAALEERNIELSLAKKNLADAENQAKEKDQLISHLVAQAAEKNEIISQKDQSILEFKQDIASLQESKIAMANQFNTHILRSNEEKLNLQSKLNDTSAAYEEEQKQKQGFQQKLLESDKVLVGYVSENSEKTQQISTLQTEVSNLQIQLQLEQEGANKKIADLKTEIEHLIKARDQVNTKFLRLTALLKGVEDDDEENVDAQSSNN